MTNQAITTDFQDELLTQVDENNNIIGSISRGLAHNKPGVYYRTVYVLIKNESGEILLQKRSSTKDSYPDCWDLSVGGHVNFGNSYIQTAKQEIEEELGLIVEKDDLVLKGEMLIKLPQSGEWFNVFEYSLKPDQVLSFSKKEINDIKWMTMEEIKKSMKNKSLQWYIRPLQLIKALY